MKYIVNKVLETIKKNAPSINSETMIRIDGFEDIRFYEKIASEIMNEFKNKQFVVDVKLAQNKWEYFNRQSQFTSYLQSLKQMECIALNESITRYRNLHKANLLILMGTELEEDKGGLLNCYSITPDTIVKELKGNYNEVFTYLSEYTNEEKRIINKLYGDLFRYVPVDLYKLSTIADKWEKNICNIMDLVELFFNNLDEWGLPIRKNNLPSYKELKSKKNILETEYKFISRSMFRTMTVSKFNKCIGKFEEYGKNDNTYGPKWEGWGQEEIGSYEGLCNTVSEFARGENVNLNRKRLEKIDFDIIDDILNIKINPDEKVKKDSVVKLYGEPLPIFSKALLYTLSDGEDKNIAKIKYNITQADVVTNSSKQDDDEMESLILAWRTVCRHTNGIIPILNQRAWQCGDYEVEVELTPADFFSPNQAYVNCDRGIIKEASTNKTVSKVEFDVKCYDANDVLIRNYNPKFIWEFRNTDAWIHNFSNLCDEQVYSMRTDSYVPITSINRMESLIFSKSEEEFFDIYDESNLDFSFNLNDFILHKPNFNEFPKYIAAFLKVGIEFKNFITVIHDEGFYASLSKGLDSEVLKLINEYTKLGEVLVEERIPENMKWILDAYIHAFNIESDVSSIKSEKDINYCIVPPWHPAALQKLADQSVFFLDGCMEWWNEANNPNKKTKSTIDKVVSDLRHMSMIQSVVDLFPGSDQSYFGSTISFGTFSVYAKEHIENHSRLKDIIHREAVFEDDFNAKEFSQMNDNAKMIYGVIYDYIKAFQNDNNLSLVFINPIELQPIVAAVYQYIVYNRKINESLKLNIDLKILVKPENKGGKNYLAYWMDEFFSQDENVNIKTYLNEWTGLENLEKLLNGNNDIVFVMDLLKLNNLTFVNDNSIGNYSVSNCLFPIVYKPTPISGTTVKRKIELSQAQFAAAFAHTQVVRFRNNMEEIPKGKYIAVREACIDDTIQKMVYQLHSKAYWVVCVDSGMDGALLKSGDDKDEYSIIGFSTGKGAYGQYNLTITARKSILNSIRKKLSKRLYQLFKWNEYKTKMAADICLKEAGKLDGISLFSAINPKDHNINEFMAYVLTSLREKKKGNNAVALKIMVHLDSYKHWFDTEIDNDENDSSSRPDFLMLEVMNTEDSDLKLQATVIECKIAGLQNAEEHKDKAVNQVKHGIKRLSHLFNPKSNSIMKRYWYAQLYRALAFAQITFSDSEKDFLVTTEKLRSIIDGNFEISWNGKVLGYWIDMQGDDENSMYIESNIEVIDIPQKTMQDLFLPEEPKEFVNISDEIFSSAQEEQNLIINREQELIDEIEAIKTVSVFEANTSSNVKETMDEESKVNSEIHIQSEKNYQIELSDEIKEDRETEEVTGKTNINEKTKKLEDIRVLIGKDKFSNEVYWEFGNPLLSNRHMLITGTSGQGKTYSVQTMVFELLKNNISSIVFDYTEGFRISQLEKEFVEKMGDKIKQHVIYETGVPINPFKRHEIDVADMKIQEKPADVAARIANIFKHVYDFGDQQFAAIFEAARKGIVKYGPEMNMQCFRKMLEEEKEFNKTAQSVLNKMAPFFYSIDFVSSKQFDWGNILYADKAEFNIFQLTIIDREMQIIITELMLWDAWYYTKSVGNKNKPFVVILDEAQHLSHKSNSPSAAILTEGRKFGWSAWFATQSLKILSDDEVVRLLQSATKLYFKPTDEEMIKMSKQLDPTNGNIWLSALKNLNKGQCIVVGDRIGTSGTFGAIKPTVTKVTAFDERK